MQLVFFFQKCRQKHQYADTPLIVYLIWKEVFFTVCNRSFWMLSTINFKKLQFDKFRKKLLAYQKLRYLNMIILNCSHMNSAAAIACYFTEEAQMKNNT